LKGILSKTINIPAKTPKQIEGTIMDFSFLVCFFPSKVFCNIGMPIPMRFEKNNPKNVATENKTKFCTPVRSKRIAEISISLEVSASE
jgi:hypothetical protein